MNNPYLPRPIKIIDRWEESGIDHTFRVENDMNLIGGQFLQLSIPGVGEAPISISDFTDKYLDMTIRKVGKLTDGIFDLQAGDKIFVRGPYGNGFNLDQYKGKNLVIVAGGTGLAPVKNVVNYFYNNMDLVKSFTLIVGFKTPNDILFRDEIKKWSEKINVVLTVDSADESWTGETGLVTKHIAVCDMKDLDNTEVIVVGPPIMMKFATIEFVKRGLAEEKIWVSFERKMSCGIGKCGHCKIDETYVCLEGPVFNYVKAKELID
ncbi:anaerobic sulfite reductase subunit AsrB [Anaeromicrobium sediminis]|uniref:Anaerobic sulfite reductase subunit B n=1 Tax=Anaeromicrobium sediminis TaxID=1478221 RepID=A0A267MIT3_9FIRM|nr:anaerobic sulfite reductase subunit AsrB [Anaeromicrobium sediminis]PAB58703.1 anaerobic sulfite reductase subunit B [Anaeromicrobium sediminis]